MRSDGEKKEERGAPKARRRFSARNRCRRRVFSSPHQGGRFLGDFPCQAPLKPA